MTMRLGALLPRAVLVALAWILATAAFTLAADKTSIIGPQPATTAAPAAPPVLTVPSVEGQAFVFAKGILEDAGFGWRVSGSVHGYSGNKVASQSPAAGTRVVDTGAPMIVLRLSKGPYAEKGAPEDSSSYPATAIKLAVSPHAKAAPKKQQAVVKKKVVPAKPKSKSKSKPTPAKETKALAPRPPAFAVKGAPKEPLDEITLTARADRLAAWVATNPNHTGRNVKRWLYQHAWIVDGANFGWSHGEQALVKLIAIDSRVERMWGVGRRSELVARAALARVRRLSR
jgi:PASTA domain-containing protein